MEIEIGDGDRDREHAPVKLLKRCAASKKSSIRAAAGLQDGEAAWGSRNLGGLTLTSRRPVMSRPGRCILDCLFVYTPSAADALAQEAVSGSCAALPRVF